MKFTDGYWQMKPQMQPNFAMEYAVHKHRDNTVEILAPARKQATRGDALNLPMLTVTLSSPLPNVIHVQIVHHKGAPDRPPHFVVQDDHPDVSITDGDQALVFQCGDLRAEVSKPPSGWRMAFYGGEALLTASEARAIAHIRDTSTGICYVTEQLTLDVGECVYGLGERFTPFVKNGQSIDMWNEDGGTASEIAYKNIPFYMTSKGYGVFVDMPQDVSFEVGSEKVARVCMSAKGERFSYYLIYGPTPEQVLERYTALTGRPALPPAWSFGLWLSTSFTTNYDEATVLSFVDGMAERGIPLSVFHFDCYWMRAYHWCDFVFDPDTFPDPRGLLQKLHQRGLKVCVWINPYIAQASHLFDEGMAHGYLLKTTDGGVWQTDLWQSGMALVDFSNPAACRWYQDQLSSLLDMGVDCLKTDFGERIPVKNIAYHDGSDPLKMHNYYTQLYNACVFDLLEKKRGKGDAVLFARSATAGGQQFPVHWGGDSTASYTSMAESLRGGLSLSMCGFGFWSHDMGGFEQTAAADVYMRWCAFGLLSSHSRLHGSSSYRVPWQYGEEASRVLCHFSRLKNRLMPYLFAQAVAAHETGVPTMRAMALAYPNDPACRTLDLQYMLGGDLLVAPIFRADGTVEYYLPDGEWTHLLTEETVSGGGYRKESHGFFSLPLLARPGSVIPLGENGDRPDYDYGQNLTLLVTAPKNGMEVRVPIHSLDGGELGSVLVTCRAGELAAVASDGIGPYVLRCGGKESPSWRGHAALPVA